MEAVVEGPDPIINTHARSVRRQAFLLEELDQSVAHVSVGIRGLAGPFAAADREHLLQLADGAGRARSVRRDFDVTIFRASQS